MEKTLATMERVYSHKFGLSNYKTSTDRYTLSVFLKNHQLKAGNTIPMHFSMTQINNHDIGLGGATSLNSMKSQIRAYGEFMERWCSDCDSDDFTDNMLFDSYDNLTAKGLACLNLEELIPFEDHLYDDPMFPMPKYHTSLPISWISGIDLINDATTWLPAQKIFLRYPSPKEELMYIRRISTGLACGSSFRQAALGAIYEVVERDSFMLTWLLKIPGTTIEIDSCRNKELKPLYNHICKHLTGEDKLFIYDISKTEGVYTILAFIKNALPSAYGLVVAASSHADPEVALLKALEELCQSQSFAYSNLLGEQGKEYQQLKIQDIDTLHKHFYYYSTGKHSNNIDFISDSKKCVRLSQMESYAQDSEKVSLEYLVQLFCQKEQPVYLADITKPELRFNGFHVLKAVIPGYVDLETTQHAKQLKYNRLQKYKEELGAEINKAPHPFP